MLNTCTWEKTKTETAHLKFMKHLLGVNKYTANTASRSELGEFPLIIDIKINVIKYWSRIKDLPQDNLTKQAYIEQNISKLQWNSSVKNILQDTEQSVNSQIKLTQQNIKQIGNCIKQKYVDFWRLNMVTEKTKLRTFIKFKTDYKFEDYLSVLKPKQRTSVSRFRTSNHNLAIEKGRHVQPKIPIEKRICNHCSLQEIEDELHFFMVCPKYQANRRKMISSVIFPEQIKNNLQKFIYLLKNTDTNIIKDVGDFIHNSFITRNENPSAI